jgi:sugar diacid utilization regulator
VVATRACQLVGVLRCSVWLRDPESGLFPGAAANLGPDYDATIRKLTAGIPADGFTEEILRTKHPVVIDDVRRDSRPVRSSMVRHGVHAMLGVPMRLREEIVGLLFLDNSNLSHRYTPEQQEIVMTFADLAAALVEGYRGNHALREKLDRTRRQARLLAHARSADSQLNELVLAGKGLASLAEYLSQSTHKPVAICDARLRCHATSAPADAPAVGLVDVDLLDHAELRSALATAPSNGCSILGPFSSAGIMYRHAVAPVDIGGERWGYLVCTERPSGLTAFDKCVLQSGAVAVAMELTAQSRGRVATSEARSALALQLIGDAPDHARLAGAAAALGFRLEGKQLALVIRGCEQPQDQSQGDAIVAAAGQGLDDALVLCAPTADGLVLLVSLCERVAPRAVAAMKQTVLGLLADTGLGGHCGISAVTSGAAGFSRAYREASEVADCVAAIGGSAGRVLAADDLGPARLLLARSDRVEVDRFLEQVLGPALDHDDASVEMLRTLTCFFDEGRSARRAATRLDIHENTIRYRLSRFRALTGLDVVRDPKDQLSLHMAVLVLRLRGALPETIRPELSAVADGA